MAQSQTQRNCAPRPDVVENLRRHHQETFTAMGLSKNGEVFEIFTALTGTWTIILTHPNGRNCLMAVGDNWVTMSRSPDDLASWIRSEMSSFKDYPK